MPGWLALPQDPVLRGAFYLACALAAVTLVLMTQVLGLSQLARRREQQRRAFQQQWRPLLAAASLSEQPPDAVAPVSANQRLWLLLLWNRTQRQLRGTARERLNRFAAQLQLDARALELIRSRSVRRRLVGLTSLRYLGEPAHWEPVEPLIRSANPSVALAAAETLVAIAPARAMALLLPLVESRRDWALPRVANLCRRAGRSAVTASLLPLLRDDSPDSSRLSVLLEWAEPTAVAPWARTSLDAGFPSARRIAATRVLGELAHPRDRPHLARLLDDPSPDVRLAGLQALRRQLAAGDADLVQSLLSDTSWWVRQEAADALVTLPGASRQQLEQLATQLGDRYGRDALARALAERQR